MLPSDWTFFGLTPKYKIQLHDEVFDLVYYGKGGFSWNDVYNLPIFLRHHYLGRIQKILKDKSDAIEKQNRKRK